MELHASGEDYLETILNPPKGKGNGSLRRYSPAHERIKAQCVPCGRNFTRGRFPDNG